MVERTLECTLVQANYPQVVQVRTGLKPSETGVAGHVVCGGGHTACGTTVGPLCMYRNFADSRAEELGQPVHAAWAVGGQVGSGQQGRRDPRVAPGIIPTTPTTHSPSPPLPVLPPFHPSTPLCSVCVSVRAFLANHSSARPG